MSEHSEIEYLAHYIMENVPGEPSQSQGAGHTAARIIASLQAELDTTKKQLTTAETVSEKWHRLALETQAELAQSTDLMHTAIDEALRAYEAQIGQLEAELTEAREQIVYEQERNLNNVLSTQQELTELREELAQAETHVAGDMAARQGMGMFHATADELYDAIMALKEHDAQATAEAMRLKQALTGVLPLAKARVDDYGSRPDEDYQAAEAALASTPLAEARGGCPCIYEEPCSPRCTCRRPEQSGGCRRCARYGSLEQRQMAAKIIVEREAKVALATAEAAALRHIWTKAGLLFDNKGFLRKGQGLAWVAFRKAADAASTPLAAAMLRRLDAAERVAEAYAAYDDHIQGYGLPPYEKDPEWADQLDDLDKAQQSALADWRKAKEEA